MNEQILKDIKKELGEINKLIKKINKKLKTPDISLDEEINLSNHKIKLNKSRLELLEKTIVIETTIYDSRPLSEMDQILLDMDIEDDIQSIIPLYDYNKNDINDIDILLERGDKTLEDILGDKFPNDDESSIWDYNEIAGWYLNGLILRNSIKLLVNGILNNRKYTIKQYNYNYEQKSEKDQDIIFEAIQNYIKFNYKNYYKD